MECQNSYESDFFKSFFPHCVAIDYILLGKKACTGPSLANYSPFGLGFVCIQLARVLDFANVANYPPLFE